MNSLAQASRDYERIEQAINFLADNRRDQPTLNEVASEINLSEFHFQKIFKRWAGLSPKQFLQCITLENAKDMLQQDHSLLETSNELGYSSPSRLHDLFVNIESITPGEYKEGGANLQITYGFAHSPFGLCLIAQTERGICEVFFVQRDFKAENDAFQKRWALSQLTRDDTLADFLARKMFYPTGDELSLLVRGTQFQVQVWRALLRIPAGETTSYSAIARAIHRPRSARAVGTAIGSNHIAYLIPCHRVIQNLGLFGNYRWGTQRKKLLLFHEKYCK